MLRLKVSEDELSRKKVTQEGGAGNRK